MVRRRAFLASTGAAGSVYLAGCLGGQETGNTTEPTSTADGDDGTTSGGATSQSGDGPPAALRLGGSAPLTGPLSGVAESVVVAYRVVEQWIEDAGGVYLEAHDTRVPLEFTLYDDESNKQRAANLYRKLIQQDDVHLTIGPLTSTITSTVAPVIEEQGMPLVSGGAGTPSLFAETAPEWGFSVITPAPETSRALVEVMADLDADARVGEIRENERVRKIISETCAAVAEEKGIHYETIQTVPQETNDFSSAIAAAKSKDVDWLFANLHADNAALCLEQATQVGGWSMLSSHKIGQTELQERVGFENLEGATGFTAWNHNVEHAGVGQFVEDYRALFEERNGSPSTPDFHAAYGAIAIQACQQTVTVADGYSPDALLDVLNEREYTETINGSFSFDGDGIVTPSIAFGTQITGTAESPELGIVWPEEAANTEPVYPMS